jgi:hypothetical protein
MDAWTYHRMLVVRFQRRLDHAKAQHLKAKAEGRHGAAKVFKDEAYDLDRGLQYMEAWSPWFIQEFEKQEVPNA